MLLWVSSLRRAVSGISSGAGPTLFTPSFRFARMGGYASSSKLGRRAGVMAPLGTNFVKTRWVGLLRMILSTDIIYKMVAPLLPAAKAKRSFSRRCETWRSRLSLASGPTVFSVLAILVRCSAGSEFWKKKHVAPSLTLATNRMMANGFHTSYRMDHDGHALPCPFCDELGRDRLKHSSKRVVIAGAPCGFFST